MTVDDILAEAEALIAEREGIVTRLRERESALEAELHGVRQALARLVIPVLSRGRRAMIMQFVMANPGCSSGMIAKGVGGATEAATMAVTGKLSRVKQGGLWRYYMPGAAQQASEDHEKK